jgi:RimJ/RimL family protein N-acetyltransferase
MEQGPDCDSTEPPAGEENWVSTMRRSLEHDPNKTRELAPPSQVGLLQPDPNGYSACYADGRRAGLSGRHRDTNPSIARTANADGALDSDETWRAKYDMWRQGWIEGNQVITTSEKRMSISTRQHESPSPVSGADCSGSPERLSDGTDIVIRPIHEHDVELERQFIEALSPSSRRFRFLDTMRSPSPALLKQLTSINAATDAAYVAVVDVDGVEREIGVARFSALPDAGDCEFAVTVADEWQERGLGTLLMRRLIEIARSRGIMNMHSSDSADNLGMRKFAEHLHFRHERDPDDATHVLYSVDLAPGLVPAI